MNQMMTLIIIFYHGIGEIHKDEHYDERERIYYHEDLEFVKEFMN